MPQAFSYWKVKTLLLFCLFLPPTECGQRSWCMALLWNWKECWYSLLSLLECWKNWKRPSPCPNKELNPCHCNSNSCACYLLANWPWTWSWTPCFYMIMNAEWLYPDCQRIMHTVQWVRLHANYLISQVSTEEFLGSSASSSQSHNSILIGGFHHLPLRVIRLLQY